MKSRRKQRKKIRIIGYIIIFLVSSILFLNNNSNITKIERVFKTIGLTTLNIFKYPVNIVEEELVKIRDKKELEKQNKDLLEKIKQYEKMELELNELKFQLKSLEETLDLNIISNKQTVPAKVINRNIGAWFSEITIDKGEKNGIDIGNSVITKSGLIGNVVKVTDYFATVRLITAINASNISVKIGTEEVKYGILTNYEKGLFSIEVLDNNAELKKGMIITTTGLTKNYPAGIVIGKIEKIELDNFGLVPEIKAKSMVDFNHLNYIEVLKGDE